MALVVRLKTFWTGKITQKYSLKLSFPPTVKPLVVGILPGAARIMLLAWVLISLVEAVTLLSLTTRTLNRLQCPITGLMTPGIGTLGAPDRDYSRVGLSFWL